MIKKLLLFSIAFIAINTVGYSQCLQPVNLDISGITDTSANLFWNNGSANDFSWEILLVPSVTSIPPTELPDENPTTGNGTLLLPTSTSPLILPVGTLTPATIYFYYIRTVCVENEKSEWAGPYTFNTETCNDADKCTYKFILSTATGTNSWNGGRIQVRQNGILIATLGVASINNTNGISVPLCSGVPFDLYWSIEGTNPQNIGISVLDPFLDVLYTKYPGEGTPLTVLYNSVGNCTPSPCSKPTNMTAVAQSTSATLSWTDNSTPTAPNYALYITPLGAPAPTNDSATVPTIASVTNPYNLQLLNGLPLTPSTAYTYYVKSLCSPSETSTWTILTPYSFVTKPINDECDNALAVTVNANQSCAPANLVHGNTYGGTASTPPANSGAGCGTTEDDIWFSFVAGPSGSQTINFTNIVATPTTAKINHSVFSGTCDALTQMYCSTALSSNAAGLTPGQTYYVRAYTLGTNPAQRVEFDLCITSPPANDNCANAQEVGVNPIWECSVALNQPGNTLGATPSSTPFTPGTGCGTTDDDVWFRFTATNNIHIINLNSIVGTPASVTLNHSVYSGSCDAPILKYCSNQLESVAAGLTPNEVYYIRVYTSGSTQGQSATFNVCVSTPPPPATNDECSAAIPIPVNDNSLCTVSVGGNIIGATASAEPSTCTGTEDDDVWFTFTATSTTHFINLLNVEGTTDDLNHAVYSGTCGDGLTLKYCSTAGDLESTSTTFITGQLYYLRVWSNSATSQVTIFDICVKSISTCATAEQFCGSSIEEPFIFANTTGTPSTGHMACLSTTPNPIYYTLKVGLAGPLEYNILQNTQFDTFGNPIGQNMDVDYVAWGPFSSPESCDQIVSGPCTPTPCPNNTTNPNFYPLGNVVDCSYDGSFTETLHIPNAQEGEYYVILITNFNGSEGYIRMVQTNYAEPNAGQTYCSNKIQLISFLDTNNNSVKDTDEINFTLGSFVYQMNNTGDIHTVNSPLGRHSIYDSNPANTYDFSFQIHPEYASYYNVISTAFNDINIPENGAAQTLYFPITMTETYNDVSVSIISTLQPRAGTYYTNKVVYKNLGPAPVSGSLAFTKDPAVSISDVNQTGIVSNSNGFTYDYTNLGPFETRSMIVTMLVPSIPTVNINDILTNQATISTTSDIDLADNTFSLSQTVVAAYDPNDKMEAHGETIVINTFDADDYLYYTIRFQNTGNANAYNVRVQDVLDAQLDEASIRMVSSSHNYVMERINNEVVWRFTNIQLVPMTVNEALSQGYISFKIKMNPGFEAGDLVPNTATIYFDSNPAIITNTFTTEFVAPLGTPEFNQENILLYPNPANTMVQVTIQNTAETIESIVLFDILGKQIKKVNTISSQHATLDVSNLSIGIYLVEIMTNNNFRQVKKFVIE